MLQNFKITLLSLIISFTILFPISTYIALHSLQNNPNKIKTEKENSKQQYTISKKQDITLLLIISPEETEFEKQNNPAIFNPYLKETDELKIQKDSEKYIIIKISAHDKKICIANIPNDLTTIVQTNEGTPILEDTLKEIHRSCGSSFLKNSIESLTNIDIDKILKIDQTTLEGILNILGGVKVLSKDKQIYNILETKKFFEILNTNPKKAFQILKNNFNNKTNLANFFATLSNLCTTDLSIYDFQCREKGFEKMIKEKDTKLIEIKIETEKNNQKDKLTKNCLKELEEEFK